MPVKKCHFHQIFTTILHQLLPVYTIMYCFWKSTRPRCFAYIQKPP